MEILLHTIALEPARWLPQRVSQKLSDLTPKIAATGFKGLEIFEPHLSMGGGEELLPELLAAHGLDPVVLSSYLQVSPQLSNDMEFTSEKHALVERVHRFGFRKVRLFPGSKVSPEDKDLTSVIAERIFQIACNLPDVEILLETHDGSIADDPKAVVALVEQIGRANVGLLWQPTFFKAEASLEQLIVQKHFIRHVHLQNRDQELGFQTLKDGVVPWNKILPQLAVDASIEFVPCAICPVEEFDLEKSLAEAVSEAEYARSIARS
jgi:sugar phosphate isomerase/epimerase